MNHDIELRVKYSDYPFDQPLDLEFISKWIETKKDSELADKHTGPETSICKDRFQRAPFMINSDDKITYLPNDLDIDKKSNCNLF